MSNINENICLCIKTFLCFSYLEFVCSFFCSCIFCTLSTSEKIAIMQPIYKIIWSFPWTVIDGTAYPFIRLEAHRAWNLIFSEHALSVILLHSKRRFVGQKTGSLLTLLLWYKMKQQRVAVKITPSDPKACSCLRSNENIWVLCKARDISFKTGSIRDRNRETSRRFRARKRSARDVFDQLIKILSFGYLQN